MVLHRHKARPAMQVGGVLHFGKLPRIHARCTNIAGLASLDHIMQRLHRLLNRRFGVETMNLIQVNIICAEAAQRGVDALHDVLARQAAIIRPRSHCAIDLAGDDHIITFGKFA